jgi:hypothetical protein
MMRVEQLPENKNYDNFKRNNDFQRKMVDSPSYQNDTLNAMREYAHLQRKNGFPGCGCKMKISTYTHTLFLL